MCVCVCVCVYKISEKQHLRLLKHYFVIVSFTHGGDLQTIKYTMKPTKKTYLICSMILNNLFRDIQ